MIYVILFGLLNRLRGWEKLFIRNTFITSPLSGVVAYVATSDPFVGLATMLGILLWSVDGWGRGFLVLHGWLDVFTNKDGQKWWIDKPTRFTYKWIAKLFRQDEYPDTEFKRKMYGLIWMTYRGQYLTPLFLFLHFYMGLPLIYGLVCSAMGLVYYISGIISEKRSVEVAEVVMGCLIGMWFV